MEISKGERESQRKGGERRSPSSPLSWYTASESCYLARIWRGLALLAELDTVKARDRQVKGYFSLLPVLLISGRKKEGMIIYGTKVLEDISSIFFESFPLVPEKKWKERTTERPAERQSGLTHFLPPPPSTPPFCLVSSWGLFRQFPLSLFFLSPSVSFPSCSRPSKVRSPFHFYPVSLPAQHWVKG